MEEIKINTEKQSIRAIERLSEESGITIYQTYLIVLSVGLKQVKNLFKHKEDENNRHDN